jgi:hypothetical protein
VESSRTGDELRLAELLAALSLVAEVGLGQPTERVVRSCLIAMRLGERVGPTRAHGLR